MKSEPSRTFIGSVVCVDLVGYSKRTTAQQSTIKAEFNRLLSHVLRPIRPEDRIILDTGDGVAVTFLGDPDNCLSMGLEMRDVLNSAGTRLGAAPGEGPVRIGINLGPLKVALDLNGRPNIVGDGIVVAERIVAFAQPGQIVASRSFHDMVSRLSDEHLAMFRFEGKHSDRNAREYEIYLVSDPRREARAKPKPVPAMAVTPKRSEPLPEPAPAAAKAEPAPAPARRVEPAPAPPMRVEPAPTPAPVNRADPVPVAATVQSAQAGARDGAIVAFLRNPVSFGITAALLLTVIFVEGWVLEQRIRGAEPSVAADSASKLRPAVTSAVPAKVPDSPAPSEPTAAHMAETTTPASSSTARGEPAPAKPAAVPPTVEPPVVAKPEPVPAKAERAKAEAPPPANSPAAVAAQAREKAAEAARIGETTKPGAASAARKIEEPARTVALRPATPPTVTVPSQTAAIPTPAPQESAPPPVVAAVTPVKRVPVSFPRAAAQQGIESGAIKARLAINAEGRVTEVKILSSDPPRVFDREAVRALEEWRFNAGAAQRSYDVEIAFKR